MPDDETSTDESTTTDETTVQLGDAGRKAISEERNARRVAEKAAKTAQAELEKLRNEGQSEAEKAIAKAKAEGSAEALSVANARVLKAEVKALAATKLADAADAVHFLDLSEFEVSEDGEVDSKAISKAIDRLVKEKPYLASDAPRSTGSADGGARGGSKSPPDMNAWLRGERDRISL